MKKVTFTLHATVTYSAERTLEIEVSEDANLQLFDPSTLNELADFDRIPWDFGENGCLLQTDYSIGNVTEPSECPTQTIAANEQ